MKKLLAIVLCWIMLFLCACSPASPNTETLRKALPALPYSESDEMTWFAQSTFADLQKYVYPAEDAIIRGTVEEAYSSSAGESADICYLRIRVTDKIACKNGISVPDPVTVSAANASLYKCDFADFTGKGLIIPLDAWTADDGWAQMEDVPFHTDLSVGFYVSDGYLLSIFDRSCTNELNGTAAGDFRKKCTDACTVEMEDLLKKYRS